MNYELRKYQKEAVDSAISAKNGVVVLPTGAGKSLVCAGIVNGVSGRSLVLQPSVEILESNYEKAVSYGMNASIYSASAGVKEVGNVTYATIGSIIKKLDLFEGIENLMIDECHLVNAKGGMYEALIKTLKPQRLIGLTATPYRLQSNSFGSSMKIITRTRPKIFKDVLYVVNPRQLVSEGFLVEPEFIESEVNSKMLKPNSTGAEFSSASMETFIFKNKTIEVAAECCVQASKKHNHILVFVESINASMTLVDALNSCGVSASQINAKTNKKDRSSNLKEFHSGKIKVMVNVGTLTTGYDFPALDCIVDARPTMSAALHYQKIGRVVRPNPNKNAFVYDLCGNVKRMGNPLNYHMQKNSTGNNCEIYSEKGRVTTRIMDSEPECETIISFGKHEGKRLRDIDSGYLEWAVSELKGERKHFFFSEIKRRELFLNDNYSQRK